MLALPLVVCAPPPAADQHQQQFIERITGNMADAEQRLATLETQVAFLEDAVSSLDAALANQQQQVLMLEQQVRLLHQQLKEHGSRLDAVDAPADAPPPHY